MKRERHKERPPFMDELEASQRNIWWGDTLRNSLTFYRFLWNGSPNPTTVQKAGLILYGSSFAGFGIMMIYAIYTAQLGQGAILVVFLLSLPFLYVGYRIIRNAFRN